MTTPDRKLLLRALSGEACRRPPFWLMRQAGRYLPEYRELRRQARDFLEFCFTPDLAVEATLQPIRRFGMDAAIMFSDILVVPYALGQSVTFQEGVGPVLQPIRDRAGLDHLTAGGLCERLRPVYDAIGRVRSALPGDVALIGFAGAPWTVATYMVEGGTSRDHAATKKWCHGDPDGFAALIGLLVDATVEHLAAQCAAGAEVVQLFDTWAGALSESAMRRWCLEPCREIAHRLHRRFPDVPVIVFPRGVGAGLLSYAQADCFACLGLDTSVPPLWAAREIQLHRPVQGNLDPMLLVAGGEAMRREVRAILAAFAQRPFVFNLGHGVVPQTPPAHVADLALLLRNQDG